MVSHVRLAQRDSDATPLPYTASPLRLLLSDICLSLQYSWALPGIFLPLGLGETDRLDELYPCPQSGISVATQAFLTVYQLLFLLSVPLAIIFMIPALGILLYAVAGLGFNYTVSLLVLNGFQRVLVSQAPVVEQPGHERERWFFINGVAGG